MQFSQLWGCGGMVDATDLKSVDLNSRVGSSPTTPTKIQKLAI